MKKFLSLVWLSFITIYPAQDQLDYFKTTKFVQCTHPMNDKDNLTDPQQPVVCILIPSSSIQLDEQDHTTYKTFLEHMQIPADFFTQGLPKNPTKPITFIFDWTDTHEGPINLKNNAERFVQDLLLLKKQYGTVPTIILTHGRGGLLLNQATRSSGFKTKIDVIIQLGTPLPKQTPKTQELFPDTTGTRFSTFFHIYNQHPYLYQNVMSQPEQDPGASYKKDGKFDPYNILLLVNNEQLSMQKELFMPDKLKTLKLVGSNLHPLCKKTADLYPQNRSFWGLISNNSQANMLVAPYNEPKNKNRSPELLKTVGSMVDAHKKAYGPKALEKALKLSDRKRLTTQYTLTDRHSSTHKLTHQTA